MGNYIVKKIKGDIQHVGFIMEFGQRQIAKFIRKGKSFDEIQKYINLSIQRIQQHA